MRFKTISILLLSLCLVLITGCRTIPVQNVINSPVTVINTNYKLANVEKAIIRAGISLGWQMQKADAGHIVGILKLRSHIAEVDITYGKESYNINYKRSENLRYDGVGIHPKYNQWIRNLDKHIRTNLSSI